MRRVKSTRGRPRGKMFERSITLSVDIGQYNELQQRSKKERKAVSQIVREALEKDRLSNQP